MWDTDDDFEFANYLEYNRQAAVAAADGGGGAAGLLAQIIRGLGKLIHRNLITGYEFSWSWPWWVDDSSWPAEEEADRRYNAAQRPRSAHVTAEQLPLPVVILR